MCRTIFLRGFGFYFEQLAKRPEVKFDWTKFIWIGSTVSSNSLMYMRADTPYKTIHDVTKTADPPKCGSTGTGSPSYYLIRLLNDAIGTKFNIVTGYQGGQEIDLAVVWQPFCAQGIVDGFAQYPTIDHNRSKTVGGLISVLAVNRAFMEKNRDATQRLVVAYLDVLKVATADQQRWAKIYAEKAGLPLPVAVESIRITTLDPTLPLESIKRISKFLSDNGVIARDVSADVPGSYTYDFLSRATGKSPAELGLHK